MTRAVAVCVMLLAFLIVTNSGSAGGMERMQGHMVRFSGAIVLMQGHRDRCQTVATCSLSCIVCAAGMLTKSTNLLHSTASAADLHRPLEGRMVSGRLYRPPKA